METSSPRKPDSTPEPGCCPACGAHIGRAALRVRCPECRVLIEPTWISAVDIFSATFVMVAGAIAWFTIDMFRHDSAGDIRPTALLGFAPLFVFLIAGFVARRSLRARTENTTPLETIRMGLALWVLVVVCVACMTTVLKTGLGRIESVVRAQGGPASRGEPK